MDQEVKNNNSRQGDWLLSTGLLSVHVSNMLYGLLWQTEHFVCEPAIIYHTAVNMLTSNYRNEYEVRARESYTRNNQVKLVKVTD